MIVPLLLQSRDNPRLKLFRELLTSSKARKALQQTVLEGIHLLDAYQQKKLKPKAILGTAHSYAQPEVQSIIANWQDIPLFETTESIYANIRQLGQGVDIMAMIDIPNTALPTQFNTDIMVLENIQDAGNVGTLLRSAAAAGVTHIVCSTGTAAAWSPRVLRAGMGAQFGLHIYEHVFLPAVLTPFNGQILATSSHATQSIYQHDLTKPTAWLMGNEGQGVTSELMQYAQLANIPQPGGQESLNVAVAGSICLFEMVRQRLDKI